MLARWCPDIPLRITVRFIQCRLLKPWMRDRGMSGHKVQAYMDAALVCLGAEMLEIVIRPVARSNHIKVSHVIARVAERRLKNRIDPNRVAANRIDVIKLCS